MEEDWIKYTNSMSCGTINNKTCTYCKSQSVEKYNKCSTLIIPNILHQNQICYDLTLFQQTENKQNIN